MEAQAKDDEAQALPMESLMQVTRVATKAKAVVAKVKRVVIPIADAREGSEVGPFCHPREYPHS